MKSNFRNSRILTVDFGSSYTKIAMRISPGSSAALVNDLPLGSPGLQFCIPSTVARISSQGTDKWLLGHAAASTVEGPGAKVFQNWKADVFGELAHGPGGPARRSDELREVALRFFAGIRHALARHPQGQDMESVPIRVCVPSMQDDHGALGWLRRVLADVGWRVAEGRDFVFEPEANALGTLTRGRNRIWTPPMATGVPHYGPVPHLASMLDTWFRNVEAAGLAGDGTGYGSQFRFLAVDVGAFTTDFGLVTFDTSFTSDTPNKPKIIQASVALGVKELDSAVVEVLSRQSRAAIEGRSISERDQLKGLLYHSEPAEAIWEGRRVRIGAGAEGEAIQEQIKTFGQRVWAAFQDFVRAECVGGLEAAVLSGGGMMIPALRDEIVRKLDARKPDGSKRVGRIFDLMDRGQAEKQLDERGEPPTTRAVDAWLRQGRELMRGGSALGGCSVFFEWPG
jgi:hypothetical protein